MVLAGGRGGHGDRAVRALVRGRRPVPRPGVGDVVPRREAEHRLELRPPLAERSDGGRLPRRGRGTPRADVRPALRRGHAAGGAAGPARRRAGRPRCDLPADVAGGGDRLARVRAHRRRPGAGLLRLRGAGGRPAAGRLRGEGRDHGALVAAPREDRADARDPRGGTAAGAGARARDRRAVGRRGRRLSRYARAARGRSRASLPAHVHVRDDRETQGRAPRPGRLPGLDRARGVLPGRRRPRRRRPLLDRHGLDHGALDRRRLRGDGRESRLRGGSARLAARPALAPRRGGARHHPRLLADAGARADPARGARGRACRRCACS